MQKINVLALPSQSTLLFFVIVIVLLGSFFLGSIGTSPIPFLPAAFGIVFLSLRSFLKAPSKRIEQEHWRIADAQYTPILQEIEKFAQKIQLTHIPHLLIQPGNQQRSGPYTFGNFRQWYIAMSEGKADEILAGLSNSQQASVAQAILIHELYHLKNGDHWKMGYVEELFKTIFSLMLWMLLFMLGLGMLMIISAPDILALDPVKLVHSIPDLSPQCEQILLTLFPAEKELATIRQKAAGINLFLVLNFILSAILPFLLSSATLLLIFFPKLWRLREYYADAGVLQQQKETLSLRSALTGISRKFLEYDISSSAEEETPTISREYDFWISMRQWKEGYKKIAGWHPTIISRDESCQNPMKIFDSWQGTTVLVGSLLLVLDILLSSPLTLIYIGNFPMHFSAIATIAIVSVSLIPHVVQGKKIWTDVLRIISGIMGLRLVWIVFTLLFLFIVFLLNPSTFEEMMRMAIASVARYAGDIQSIEVPDFSEFLIRASLINLFQILILFIVSIFGVLSNLFFTGRILYWFKFPDLQKRLSSLIYGSLAANLFFWSVGVLLPLTWLLNSEQTIGFLGWGGVVCAWLFFIIFLVVFFVLDRHYAYCCNQCNSKVPDNKPLEVVCPACKKQQLLWLARDIA
ncbi:MAG: hypothetical protein AB9888_12935 [Bacteroidales bacterium]